jgi:hypothetical protein
MVKAKAVIANESIEITVTAQGNITFNPTTWHEIRGNTICWTCGQGPFAIQFLGISPLNKADDRSHRDEPQKLCLKVRADAQSGVYPYACAVCADGQVYMDASCPAIIID